MHLSLKGSLIRSPMLNRVGQRLLQLFEGASAAYSLRDLASNIASVVRVRRASDNSEKDFSAADVSSGAMTQWVNAQVVPPLDVRELVDGERTGALIPAAAAYSLRNLSASYTGNVVEVRRSSDNAEDSFTAAEVADGTLTDWVNEDIDKLDLQTESGGLIGNVTNETATGFDFSVNNEGSDGFKNLLPIANVSAGNYTVTLDVTLNSGSLAGCNLFHTDVTGVITPLTTGANSINLTADAASNIFFYILGTAVADVSITNITFTQTTADGFVTRWYDQSGNDNHATQGTPASQPKIVDAGSLVSGGIDFDGVDDVLGTSLVPPNVATLIGVANWDIEDQTTMIIGARDSTSKRSYLAQTSAGRSAIGVAGSALLDVSVAAGDDYLLFGIHSGSTRLLSTNGTVVSDSLGTAPNNTVHGYSIGALNTAGTDSSFMDGTIAEVIIYDSDQSDNRTAFEANIGETYGIDLPSGVDTGYDQVDGFVETWYDQSSSVVTNYDVYPTIAYTDFDLTGVVFTKTDEETFTVVANNSTRNRYINFVDQSNGIRKGKHRIAFDLTLNSGSLGTITGFYTDIDSDPYNGSSYGTYSLTEGSNVFDVEIFDDGVSPLTNIFWKIDTGSTFDISVTNFRVSHVTESIVRNGNDATQQVSGNQPKIVDAGVLVTDRDGKVALNGKGAKLNLPSNAPMLSSDGSYSLFAAVDFDDQRNGNNTYNNIIGFTSKTDGGASDFRKPLIYAGQNNGELRLSSPSNPSGTASLTLLETVGVQLLTNIANPALSTGNNTAYVDGVLVSSANSNTDVNTETLTGNNNTRLFDLQETTVETFLSEVIYYPSDQSANREAIEANINNQYDIY